MAKARPATLKSPDGIIYRTNAIKPFCREFNLTAKHVYRTIAGLADHHKHWTTPFPQEVDAALAANTLVEKSY